ncbi:hypothetical protein [Salibacterium halotolerans]|uniref:ParE toxin of type II toxin-antitoxin system, parDE n=1 Tax=Salibacterium halotolerans TaxID=1884432 RepID=A0A1I5S6F6_9BACI|nr:hypothetical protein [Salibacterium halotolerans]SFP66260.1 hypothetical protein SAMN05518683_10866 [Salibacterium halotolerans]
MKIKWTKTALEGFRQIGSKYFTSMETSEYKIKLVTQIEEKIYLLGTSIPADYSDWEGTYKILVDEYIVYYSFSDNFVICYIEYFMHSKQNRQYDPPLQEHGSWYQTDTCAVTAHEQRD